METKEINDLIKEMTLEEKAVLINGASFFGTAGIPRHNISRLQLLDGGTGINFEQLFGDFYSVMSDSESTNGMIGSTLLSNVIENFYQPENLTDKERKVYIRIKEKLDSITGMPDMAPGCFPPGILLGATFSPQTVYEVGEALGMEAYAYKIDILLGTPNVNIHRDVLNGRLFEGYSEDPCLAASLAPELVKGVQKYPIAANVKHFAANNQETNRTSINETISKRALEEIYFPAFKACVKDGRVKTVMSAYNRINGVPCTENKWLLKDTLREEWGFRGTVLSDWGAVYNPSAAVSAGNDLAMPGPIDSTPIVKAVNNGELTETAVNEAAMNMLSLIADLSEQKKQHKSIEMSASELMEYTDKAALKAALEGIVLLKNENNIFPVNKNVNRIFITGSGRERLITCGSGSAGITTNRDTSLSEELMKIYGNERIRVQENISENDVINGDVILAVVSLSGMEGNDRPDMIMSPSDRETADRLVQIKKNNANIKTGLILNICGPVEIADYVQYIDGIFCMFLPGMQGGKAMAHLIAGKASPSGKLPLSYPKYYRDTPTLLNFPGEGNEVNYGEGIYVGYRYYDKKETEPLYPFGYGLSYTRFEISGVETDKNIFENEITVSGSIKNIGETAGSEVVQIYVSDVVSSVPKPVKELKKFSKIFLDTNEEKEFHFTLDSSDFSYFDMDYDRFLCEEGYFDIIVSTSSARGDIAAKIRVYKKGESPYSYGINSTVKVLYENPNLKKAMLDWFDAENLDRGIIESNYQYTPSRKLSEIIPAHIDTNPKTNTLLSSFLTKIKAIEKP